jgi:hypothetical protein
MGEIQARPVIKEKNNVFFPGFARSPNGEGRAHAREEGIPQGMVGAEGAESKGFVFCA